MHINNNKVFKWIDKSCLHDVLKRFLSIGVIAENHINFSLSSVLLVTATKKTLKTLHRKRPSQQNLSEWTVDRILLTVRPASTETGRCFREFCWSCCPSVTWTRAELLSESMRRGATCCSAPRRGNLVCFSTLHGHSKHSCVNVLFHTSVLHI